MEPELRDILRTAATDSVGDSHTHVSLYGPHARWSVGPDNQTDFWTRYCDLVDRKNNGRDGVQPDLFSNMCLAERPQEVMPQIAKLTFKFHAEIAEASWEPYDDEFLYWMCHTYQTVLAECFNITTDTQMELVVVVLESRTHWYEVDRETGQRFMIMEVRLQFPYGRVEAGMQNRIVRPRVIQLLRNNNVLAKMQRQPVADWEQIISSNTSNEPVVMYGSSEIQGRPKLEMTHIWPYISRDMLEGGFQPDELTLDDSFIPQNHFHVQQQTVRSDIFDNGRDLTYWMPMFLSLGYWPTVLLAKKDVNDGGRFTNQLRTYGSQPESQRIFGASGRQPEYVDDSNMELAERLIPMINVQRYLRESYWIEIGKALYISDEGGENGLLSWIRHTERALIGITNIPEFTRVADTLADTCRNLYYTFANSSITVKTLASYAREDSPDRYGNWHREWCMASMEQALSGLTTDVGIALHRVYWLDFVYCPIGKGKWFQFRNHRWYEVHQGIELRKIISRDFMKRFESIRMILSRQIHDSTDDAFKANGEITMKKITQLIGSLKTVRFKSSLMTEACEPFSNDHFTNLLDTNPELTGVTNGILEVSGNNILFRAAKPEDYISMCTNIPYHVTYTWNHPLVQECMKWFGQIFTDRSLLHHFLKFAASCLKGRNSDKIFPIFTGEGDNSKSMIVKLFEATFNSYCIKLDISNVTGHNGNAAGPTPQLARAKATRVAFMDEPEDDIPMHKGIIKKWVGGDSFFGRLLQDNGGDIQITFKLVLTCNKVPVIPRADKAIKNRTRLFPFLNTWVDDPPEDEAEQYIQHKFKKNPLFERRIPILSPAFLWIITQYYPYYSVEGLPDPAIVTETTEAYWRENDVYAQFAADTIQEVYTPSTDGCQVRDSAARVTLSEIYTEFKLWFRDAFPGTKVPERPFVRAELSARWGRMYGNAWHGIRIMNNEAPTDMSSALGGKAPRSTTGTENRKLAVGATGNNAVNVSKPTTINQPPEKQQIELIVDRPASPFKGNIAGAPTSPPEGFIVAPTSPPKGTLVTPTSPPKGIIPRPTSPSNGYISIKPTMSPKGQPLDHDSLIDVKHVVQAPPLTPIQRSLGLPPGTVAI